MRWFVLLLVAQVLSPWQENAAPWPGGGETLRFRAEWRLIHAGDATLTLGAPSSSDNGARGASLHLESAGIVSRLYRVNNNYTVSFRGDFCVISSLLHAEEGKRRRETRVTFDGEGRKAFYHERDLIKNTVVNEREIDIPACVHDVIGGLYRLRALRLEPGQTAQLPVSDGKKSILARVEAQEREALRTPAGQYKTIRYEAFLFNDVLYRRKGRLFVWLTDDERRLPVQIRARLQFHVGTITLQLVKEELS